MRSTTFQFLVAAVLAVSLVLAAPPPAVVVTRNRNADNTNNNNNDANPLCGNGVVDAGEECDPAASVASGDISPECCTDRCQRAPAAWPCSGGLGACSAVGQCLTRAVQCSRYDRTQMQLPSSTSAGAALLAVTGPFTPCYPPPANPQPQVRDIVSLRSTANGVSVLDQLLPAKYAQQAKCTAACQGTLSVNGSLVCVDFTAYSNFNQDRPVPDYVSCVVDNSATAVLADAVREPLGAAGTSASPFASVATPGICLTGVCRTDICRVTRCSNQGDCMLAPDAVSAMENALGASDVKWNTSAIVQQGSRDALIQCRCDDGWTGPMCQTPGSNSNGTISGDDAGQTNQGEVSEAAYRAAIAASVLGTLVGTLLLLFLAVMLVRSRDKAKKQAEVDTVAIVNSQKRPGDGGLTAGLSPTPTHFDTLSAGDARSNIAAPAAVAAGAAAAAMATRSTDQKELPVPEDPDASKAMESPAIPSAVPSPALPVLGKSAAPAAAVAVGAAAVDSQEKQDAVEPLEKDAALSTLPANYLCAVHAYVPRLADELQLLPGDILYLIKAYDDGWAKAYSLRTGKEGIFPLSFSKRVDSDAKLGDTSNVPAAAAAATGLDFNDATSDRASSLHDS